MASTLDVTARQLVWLATAALGVLGVALAVGLRRRGAGLPAVALAVAAPALAALVLLPGGAVAGAADPGLVGDFRLVTAGTQAVFWGVLAAAGAALSARGAPVPRPAGRG